MLFVSPLAGRMTNRFGARLPLVLGSLATALAFGFLALAHDDPWEFYVGAALLGVGIGLAFASLANLIVAGALPLPPKARQAATQTVGRTMLLGLGCDPELLPAPLPVSVDPRVLKAAAATHGKPAG
jgi:MFS family permease